MHTQHETPSGRLLMMLLIATLPFQVLGNNNIPPDVKPSCEMAFSDHQQIPIPLNGAVSAANSLNFNDDSHCNFYRWSWQMFLWLTSPDPSSGQRVFRSKKFYVLNDNDSLTQGGIFTSLRREKVDFDGQAGRHGVLSPQSFGTTPGGTLIYYSVFVNDVYKFMAEGNANGAFSPPITGFPTTPGVLQQIKNYARAKGVNLEDADALTMELKTSWVVLTNAQLVGPEYITITADLPKYSQKTGKNGEKELVWDGKTFEKNATLGLVGFHIVGSAKGHPEMIWSTFEHKDNTPNSRFPYINKNNQTKTFSDFKDGIALKNWLFFRKGDPESSGNVQMMKTVPDAKGLDTKIVALPGHTLGEASNTYRVNPWGSCGDAWNNTEILAVNQSVLGMLDPRDVRSNYLLIGAIWTNKGVVPGLGPHAVKKGSTHLANSTMETYEQGHDCFSCHNGGDLTGLSHVYSGIEHKLKK